ncbi:MAG TPA: SirB2 family protein [Flavobacterium sp.]|nr:SirB2 family protein [Flavobacterium sp.]
MEFLDHTGIKHTHTLLVTLFLISAIVKTVLLLNGSVHTLERYRKRFLMPEMLIAILFLATGLLMWYNMDFVSLGGWIHLKLALIVIAIPLGIIGFKKNNVVLSVISTLLFIAVFTLAFIREKIF